MYVNNLLSINLFHCLKGSENTKPKILKCKIGKQLNLSEQCMLVQSK